jgi:hypothetical protein
LALAIVFFLGVFLWFPRASFAHAGHCFDDWQTCRTRALQTDDGWIRTTLILTVCDVSLGKCLLLN